MFDLAVRGHVHRKLQRARSCVVVVCLSIAALLSADVVAAVHGCDDPVCDAQSGVAFGATAGPSGATSVGAGTGSTPQHCPICQWLRSLRSLSAYATHVAFAIEPVEPIRFELFFHQFFVPVLQVPARSPPA